MGTADPPFRSKADLERRLFTFVAAADQGAETANLGVDLQLKTLNLRTALEEASETPIRR